MEVPLEGPTGGGKAPPPQQPPPEREGVALGNYYDRLARWTSWAQGIGYGGGRRTLTVHRALADPLAGGQPTVTRLHDVLLSALPAQSGHVLDAGCGFGGTMLACAARWSARFTGVTLSEQQAAIGRRAIALAGLAHRIDILLRSYDAPPEGPFDLTIAIESLAHSPNPAASIAAIAARLAPGGYLAIVDDMPAPAARGARDLATFQHGWALPALLSVAELESALRDCGLALVATYDLTADVQARSLARIAALEMLNRCLYRVAPGAALRGLLDSYQGGLALERLYQHGLMSYRLLVARKHA